ncbi:MAG: DUF6273 domain-containing protein [Oscillospiraceae bacterium]|nr:DUF6273 domain-containing protein [Oscillospiraceae bacterium]
MKKLLAILGALIVAAGAAAGGYYLGAQSQQKAPDDKDSGNAFLDSLPVQGDWGGYEWVVLKKEPGRWLCMTKEIVEVRKFHEAETPVSWADSGLRAYLNGAFLEEAFGTSGDRDRVLLTENSNGSVTFPNGNTGVDSADTQDYVFLLSYEEAEAYFPDSAARVAMYNGQARHWWLRSPGDYVNEFANVDGTGQVNYSASDIHTEGLGVRPAIWRFHASYDVDLPPAFGEMLVGLWQNGPSVGSAISECYRFYEDGSYTFTPSPFVFDPEGWRPPASEGRYVIEDGNVTLLKAKSTVIEGGTWAEDEIAGYVLEGGTERIVAHPEPKEIYTVYLGVFAELNREMFCIDGRTYWKLSADPDAYLD